MKVRICDPKHPHFPEFGTLTGEMIQLLGEPMAKMNLEGCIHGTDACFVGKGQVTQLETLRPAAKRKGGR